MNIYVLQINTIVTTTKTRLISIVSKPIKAVVVVIVVVVVVHPRNLTLKFG